ncbi:MAG: histidine kinase, partial [Bacteroidota bacterium]
YKVDLQNLRKHYLHGPIDDFDLVNYIDIDHQKNFWLLSESGAIVLDSVGRDVYLLPNQDRVLKGRYLHNMINSKDNSYWFGSLGTGLFHIPNISTLHFKAENSGLQSNKIKLLKKVGAQLLVFTNDGHIYDWKNGQLKPLFWQKDCKEIYAVHETPSDLVLLYLDLSNIKSIQHIQYLPKTALLEGKLLNRMEPAPLILASGGYKSSCVDPWNLNDIHFGSAGGLCIFNKSLTENVTNRMESWRDVRNKQLFTDRFVPKIWIGKPNQLHYLEQPQDSSIAIQYRGKPLEIQVESIHQTIDSTIWVGTAANGVVGIRGDSIYTRLTVEDGLGNNACRYLHAGDEPYLWIVHSEGINRYDIRTGSMRHVNASDGMLSKNIYSVHQSGEQLLVGTEDGLFQLEVDDIEKLIPPTALHINQLKIWAADYPLQGDELSLPYNQNNLEIGFRGISIKSFQKIDYRYRMLGIDSTWTDIPKGVQFVHFPQLSYGDYQFELEALNADGVRSTQAATLNINISPPYWRTWWFSCLVIGGIALLTALIVNFIFRYRYRQQQKEQELLQQIQQLRADALRAQMNPHFIFNALNAILLFLARNDEKSAILFLSKFSRLIRYIFEYSHKDEIPIAEEIQLIEIYLNLEALRFKDKVDIQMKVSDSLRDAGESIPPLLIQPIIENSFKHGLFHKKERGVLKLHFKDLEDSIKVVIEDNGIGRKKAAELIRKKKIKRSISSQQVISDRIAVINQKADDPEKVVLKSEDLFDEVGNAAGLRTTFTFKVN